jgi:hypothetical protein
LANTKNYDLQDRLVYKLSKVSKENRKYVCNLLLNNVSDERLRAKIISQKEI